MNLQSSLGASACIKLGRYEEAIAWCDRGLAVSFLKQYDMRMTDTALIPDSLTSTYSAT